MKRIKLFHLYGPEVFEEAWLDPIKTMRKDILPRFCRSPIFETMIQRLSSCDPPPPAIALHVPLPVRYSLIPIPPPFHLKCSNYPLSNHSLILLSLSISLSFPSSITFQQDDVTLLASGTLEEFPESRTYTLNEVITSAVGYPVFMEFLVGAVSTENLLCVRMIDMFEHLMSIAEGRNGGDNMTVGTSVGTSAGAPTSVGTSKASTTTVFDEKALEAAIDQAWETYRFFVTPGASFEVSIHHLLRKHIMLHMGKQK